MSATEEPGSKPDNDPLSVLESIEYSSAQAETLKWSLWKLCSSSTALLQKHTPALLQQRLHKPAYTCWGLLKMLNFFHNSARNFWNRGHHHIVNALHFHDWKCLRRFKLNNQEKWNISSSIIPPDWRLNLVSGHNCFMIAYWIKTYVKSIKLPNEKR